MIMFKIGARDYSNRVIAGSYQINTEPVYKSWQDQNGIEHREPIRYRTKGSFDMYFDNIEDYEEFKNTLEAAKQLDMSYANIVVTENTSNKEKVINPFISFKLTRNRNGQWHDIYERFKVDIQER